MCVENCKKCKDFLLTLFYCYYLFIIHGHYSCWCQDYTVSAFCFANPQFNSDNEVIWDYFFVAFFFYKDKLPSAQPPVLRDRATIP